MLKKKFSSLTGVPMEVMGLMVSDVSINHKCMDQFLGPQTSHSSNYLLGVFYYT